MSEEVLAARIVVTVGLSGMGDRDPFFLEITDIGEIGVLESRALLKDQLVPIPLFPLKIFLRLSISVLKGLDSYFTFGAL